MEYRCCCIYAKLYHKYKRFNDAAYEKLLAQGHAYTNNASQIACVLSGVGRGIKWSPRTVSFSFHGSPVIFTPLYRWRSRHPERVKYLLQVTWLRSAWLQIGFSQPLDPCLSHSRCSINGEAALLSSVRKGRWGEEISTAIKGKGRTQYSNFIPESQTKLLLCAKGLAFWTAGNRGGIETT